MTYDARAKGQSGRLMRLRGLQTGIKYASDRLLAAVLLIALLPVFVIIGLSIRLEDQGPVFFRQQRIGKDGRQFDIWKFRTMVVDADRFLDGRGSVTGAGRITRIGRLLRATSIDELPQLINILLGDMSFVGPRPGLVEHYRRYTAEQKRRYAMRPGVTGLAQVNGRNTLLWSRRIEYDLDYIRRYSLWLDLKILVRTVYVVLAGSGMKLDRNPEEVDDLPRPDHHHSEGQ